ncbi:MAG: MarR family transcriptional regulator [Clostridia bacterium]|nr:MarR family transcriptional regulator [Clostridia bacterium]
MVEPRFEVFFSYISGIYRAIQSLRARFSKESGIQSVHVFWIHLLRRHPEGLTAAEIARLSQTTNSLVSREIKALVERKLIYTQEPSPRRRYAWKFRLTPGGQAIAEDIDRVAINVQTTVSLGISAQEMETFYSVLSRLYAGFSQIEAQNITGGNYERPNNR